MGNEQSHWIMASEPPTCDLAEHDGEGTAPAADTDQGDAMSANNSTGSLGSFCRRTVLGTLTAAGLLATGGVGSAAGPPDGAGPPDDVPPDHAGPDDDGDIQALDPRGIRPPIELTPLAPRPEDLGESTVWLVDTGDGSEHVYDELVPELEERYPGVEVEVVEEQAPEDEFLDLIEAEADAFVHGGSHRSTVTGNLADRVIELESRGVPGVFSTSEALATIAEWRASVEGIPIRSVPVPIPMDDLSDEEMESTVEEFIDALTSNLTEEEQETGVVEPTDPGVVAVEGTLREVKDYFLEHGWTDGQAISPPTREAVDEMLSGTSHDPDTVVAEDWGPEGWDVPVESVAINAVMADAKPEYMPILLATIEGAGEVTTRSPIGGDFGFVSRSTNGFGAMQVVNGPIANEIDMNAETGALEPGNRANATIGRALQLFLRNLGGGEVGFNMRPTMGNNTLYGGVAFAENEEHSPWEPHHVSQGYDEDESVLTFKIAWNAQIGNYEGEGLDRAEELSNAMKHFDYPGGMVPLLSPGAARHLAEEEDMTKEDFADFMHQETTYRLGDLRDRPGHWDLVEHEHEEDYGELPDDAEVPVYPRQHINPVVVGNHGQNPHHHGWTSIGNVQVSIDDWR